MDLPVWYSSSSSCVLARPWWAGRQYWTRFISFMLRICMTCRLWMNDSSVIIWCSRSPTNAPSSPVRCYFRLFVGELVQFVVGLSGLFCIWIFNCAWDPGRAELLGFNFQTISFAVHELLLAAFFLCFLREHYMQVPLYENCLWSLVLLSCVQIVPEKKVLVLIDNRPSWKCPSSSCVHVFRDLLMFHVVIILYLLKR